jgi:hypothetical protein
LPAIAVETVKSQVLEINAAHHQIKALRDTAKVYPSGKLKMVTKIGGRFKDVNYKV